MVCCARGQKRLKTQDRGVEAVRSSRFRDVRIHYNSERTQRLEQSVLSRQTRMRPRTARRYTPSVSVVSSNYYLFLGPFFSFSARRKERRKTKPNRRPRDGDQANARLLSGSARAQTPAVSGNKVGRMPQLSVLLELPFQFPNRHLGDFAASKCSRPNILAK